MQVVNLVIGVGRGLCLEDCPDHILIQHLIFEDNIEGTITEVAVKWLLALLYHILFILFDCYISRINNQMILFTCKLADALLSPPL